MSILFFSLRALLVRRCYNIPLNTEDLKDTCQHFEVLFQMLQMCRQSILLHHLQPPPKKFDHVSMFFVSFLTKQG